MNGNPYRLSKVTHRRVVFSHEKLKTDSVYFTTVTLVNKRDVTLRMRRWVGWTHNNK